MTNTRWAIVVLVVALSGVCFWLGQRSVTASDEERAAWQAASDSVLGVQARRYDDSVAALRRMSDSAYARAADLDMVAVQLRERARATESASRRWSDSLMTAARSAADSLALYPALVASLNDVVTQQNAVIAVQDSVLHGKSIEVATWQARAALDSTRIADLTRQLTTVPKPPRPKFNLLGLHVGTCAFAGVSPKGLTYGLGFCVTK